MEGVSTAITRAQEPHGTKQEKVLLQALHHQLSSYQLTKNTLGILDQLLRDAAASAALLQLQQSVAGDTLAWVARLLGEIAQCVAPASWHPPTQRDAIRAARCIRTQTARWPLLTRPFTKLIFRVSPESLSKLRRIIFYCRPTFGEIEMAGETRARLFSRRADDLVQNMESLNWPAVQRKDLIWLAESLEECLVPDIRKT